MLTLEGHAAEVHCIAFSPDGKTIASGSEDKTIQVWDAAAGSSLLTMEGHTGQVLALAYSPDGSTIASLSWDQTIRLWDVTSGSWILTLAAGHMDGVTQVTSGVQPRRPLHCRWRRPGRQHSTVGCSIGSLCAPARG
mmetsp:Transcript_4946/g.10916  ORF Transcript_4946/g.10916 Transcript_4946/m.10916 type:complete len:137 (-) Transcript_4946:340-750(-)